MVVDVSSAFVSGIVVPGSFFSVSRVLAGDFSSLSVSTGLVSMALVTGKKTPDSVPAIDRSKWSGFVVVAVEIVNVGDSRASSFLCEVYLQMPISSRTHLLWW